MKYFRLISCILISIALFTTGCRYGFYVQINVKTEENPEYILLKKSFLAPPGMKINKRIIKMALNGDIEKAAERWREIIKAGIPEPEIHYNLGLLYEITGKIRKAEKEYLNAYYLNPRKDIFIRSYAAIHSRTKKDE